MKFQKTKTRQKPPRSKVVYIPAQQLVELKDNKNEDLSDAVSIMLQIKDEYEKYWESRTLQHRSLRVVFKFVQSARFFKNMQDQWEDVTAVPPEGFNSALTPHVMRSLRKYFS